MSARHVRTPAEWATFGVSVAILAVVVALIGLQMRGGETPAAPEVTTGRVLERGGAFHLPVTLRNGGDATAENVQVVAEVEVGDEAITADQVVDFLPGGASEALVFVFADDPRNGRTKVRVTGFTEP